MSLIPVILAAAAILSQDGLAGIEAGISQARSQCCDLYPEARGDLVVENDSRPSGPTLKESAQQYAELTGQHLVYSDETDQLLSTSKTGLHDSVLVPKDEVQSFFEEVMIANQYVVSVMRSEEPRLLRINSLRTQARNTVRSKAHYVPADRLGHFSKHAATMITTTLAMQHTDVRQLSNSMRTMVTDANTLQMLPAGNTNTIVLTGFGDTIASLSDMLRAIDAASEVTKISAEIAVIRLEHAHARELLKTVNAVAGGPAGAGAVSQGEGEAPVRPARADAPRIVMDERTNSLIVAALPDDMQSIKELIARLDVEQ